MNAWIVASCVLLIALGACGWRCCRGETDDRLVALIFAGELATIVMLAFAVAFGRSFYIDCALAVAILPYPSSIVLAYFYEKWV